MAIPVSTPVSTPETRVNPLGESRLYLRTEQIPRFFEAFGNYCETIKAKARRNFWITMGIYLFFSFLSLAYLMDEFDLGDDEEGGIIIMAFIALAIVLVVMIVIYRGRQKKHGLLHARQQILQQFFGLIQADLHPESGLKGILDHGKHAANHVYKEKTSPYSGAKKKYYKFPWARLKFTLIDGTSLRLECLDKIKDKGGAIVRFEAIQKAKLQPNSLLYQSEKTLIPLRRTLCLSEQELRNNAGALGEQILESLKTCMRQWGPKQELGLPALAEAAIESKKVQPSPSLAETPLATGRIVSSTRLLTYLNQSELPGLNYTRLAKGGFRVKYTPASGQPQNNLTLSLSEEGELTYLRLYLPVLLPQAKPEELLRANPALAYGRFAALPQAEGKASELFLTKTLLYATLDQAELDTAIHGLATQGSQLAEVGELPVKAKAFKGLRQEGWEQFLLQESLQGLNLELTSQAKKFRVQLPISEQRKQTVHVRFDRQDLEGHPMIAIQSFCGAQSPELYKLCLEENGKMAYGAIGLAKLGNEEMFVVGDNQLAATADPAELRAAILQIAHKADNLEALLTGADRH